MSSRYCPAAGHSAQGAAWFDPAAAAGCSIEKKGQPVMALVIIQNF
jgi:hypothetical protein